MSNETLFRKSSLNSISSPDQLNDYIKVANPGIWLVLAAMFVLLAAVFIWGVTGSLPTTVSAKGLSGDGAVVCYVSTDDADAMEVGQSAFVTDRDGSTYKGNISDVAKMPLSASEITAGLKSEYLAFELIPAQFAVKLTIDADAPALGEGTLIDVQIVTDTVRPIDFLIGR